MLSHQTFTGIFKGKKGPLATSLDDTIQNLIIKVNECLSLDGSSLNVDDTFKDACIKREIMAMIQEGSVDSTDSVQILTSRIRSLLSRPDKEVQWGKKSKKEELRLSKLDEWYMVQQYLVKEEKESKKRMARKKTEEVAKIQNERRQLLKKMNEKRLDERKKKADELHSVRENVLAAQREAKQKIEARKITGQRLKNERQAQVKLERKKKEILHDLKRVVDGKEKQSILESIQKEEQMIQNQKSKARAELQLVLEENQKSQKQKLEQAKADKEENKRCMEEYSRMLLKQEQERKKQLEKIQEIQKDQEITGACHALHAKKWVEDSVVAQQASEMERKQAERDENMLLHQKKRKMSLVAVLNAQMEEKRAERAKERYIKSVEKDKLSAMNAEVQQMKQKQIQNATNACIKLKDGLDEQIRQQRKAIRDNMGMNQMERCLNAKMLQKVHYNSSSE